jgi:hypothetical protein
LYRRRSSPYWYVLFEHKGKPHAVSLQTTDVRVGRTRAVARWEAVKSEQWAAPKPEAPRPAPPTSTLGEILDRYEEAIFTVNTEIDPATVHANALAFARLVSVARPDCRDIRGLSSSVLTEDLVAEFRTRYLASAGDDLRKQESRRRGGNSVLRQARSLFARPAMRLYRHLHLPELESFLEAPGYNAKRALVREIQAATIAQISHASLALPDAVYLAHVCFKHLGMRNLEIEGARWFWLQPAEAGGGWMDVDQTADFDPKASLGRIPVPRDVYRLLDSFRAADQDFLIAAANPTERTEVVNRAHSEFVKRFLDGSSHKTSYRLRKWAADTIRMKYGDDASKAFLRHSDKSVAGRHYWSAYNWRRLAELRHEDPGMIGITLEDVGFPRPFGPV